MSATPTGSIDIDQPGYVTLDRLGAASTRFFRENGYLVLTGAVSGEERRTLIDEAAAVCRGKRGELGGAVPMLENADAMTDDEVLRHFLCIHQPHKFSSTIRGFLSQRGIVEVLTRVIGPNVKCMQSMLFIKAAGKPGQAWHQDEDYIPTRDRSLCGAWIAIDDAVIRNGCLWVIPGSHQRGILYPQYPHDDRRFDCALEAYGFPYTEKDEVPVEVPAGSIVFFNGYLLHRSLPNRSETGYRRVLVNHYMSAESLLPWRHKEGVGMARTDFRDVVMVAGEDPYAYKGYEDITRPHVRKAGDGGCGDGRSDLDTFLKTATKEQIARA